MDSASTELQVTGIKLSSSHLKLVVLEPIHTQSKLDMEDALQYANRHRLMVHTNTSHGKK